MRHANGLFHVSVWLALAARGPHAAAQTAEPADDWVRANEDQPAQMRGGSCLPSELAVSLGIERLVSTNGNIAARTSFDISKRDRRHDPARR
jgi:hypothetical protein